MFNNRKRCWKATPVNSPPLLDDLHGCRIPGKPGVLKTSSDMVTSLFKDAGNFNKVGGCINASESKEFHSTMWSDTGHGPTRSTATSSQGAPAMSRSGNKPWPGPEGLAHWQMSHSKCFNVHPQVWMMLSCLQCCTHATRTRVSEHGMEPMNCGPNHGVG